LSPVVSIICHESSISGTAPEEWKEKKNRVFLLRNRGAHLLWALQTQPRNSEPAPVTGSVRGPRAKKTCFLMPRRRAIAKPVGNFDGGVLGVGSFGHPPFPTHSTHTGARAHNSMLRSRGPNAKRARAQKPPPPVRPAQAYRRAVAPYFVSTPYSVIIAVF